MTQTEYKELVDRRMHELLTDTGAYPKLQESMIYSVSAGGKRLRPVLHLMSCAMLGGNVDECIDTACAIELIHTYSLIHDDLPAMDDDALRRGRPTNHTVYGEGMALLAGDALLNYAVQVAVGNALRHPDSLSRHVRAIDMIFSGSGTRGMLSGQAADIDLVGQRLSEETLNYIHARKTGALITASVVSGAIMGGASQNELAAVLEFGTDIGVAFQITDDILDVEGSADILGKDPGRDEKNSRATYVTLHGIEVSREMAKQRTERACSALSRFGQAAGPLADIAMQISNRVR